MKRLMKKKQNNCYTTDHPKKMGMISFFIYFVSKRQRNGSNRTCLYDDFLYLETHYIHHVQTIHCAHLQYMDKVDTCVLFKNKEVYKVLASNRLIFATGVRFPRGGR